MTFKLESITSIPGSDRGIVINRTTYLGSFEVEITGQNICICPVHRLKASFLGNLNEVEINGVKYPGDPSGAVKALEEGFENFNPGGGSSSAILVPEEWVFATAAARDAYFTAQPDQLQKNIHIVVDGLLQQYRNSGWVDCPSAVSWVKLPERTLLFKGTEAIHCRCGELQSVIDALPRFLNRDVVITVTDEGALPSPLQIKRFSGIGILCLEGAWNFTEVNGIEIGFCSNPGIEMGNFKSVTGSGDSISIYQTSSYTLLRNCCSEEGANTDENNVGAAVERCERVHFRDCRFSWKYHVIRAKAACVSVENLMGVSNHILYRSSQGSEIRILSPGIIIGMIDDSSLEGSTVIDEDGIPSSLKIIDCGIF